MAKKIGKCPLHPDMDLYLHEKEGKTWRAHKLSDGTWCHPDKGGVVSSSSARKEISNTALNKFCLELAAHTPSNVDADADTIITTAEKYRVFCLRKGMNTIEKVQETPPF